VKDFTEAIKYDSRHAEAYANRGIALLQEGRTAEGDRDIARAINLKPGLQAFIEKRIAEKLHR
jgi:Flp pilus assembly protein TadD